MVDDKDIVQTIKGNLELDGYEVLTPFNGRIGHRIVKTSRAVDVHVQRLRKKLEIPVFPLPFSIRFTR